MPTLTVLAPDSALAMDEIARQLGEDAFILSTSQRDGMIEIKATNDPLPSSPRKAVQARSGFAAVLTDLAGEEAVTVLNRARTAPPTIVGRVETRVDTVSDAGGAHARPVLPPMAKADPQGSIDAPPPARGDTPAHPGPDRPDLRAALAAARALSGSNPSGVPTSRGQSDARLVDGAEGAAGVLDPERRSGASVHALPVFGSGGAGSAPLRRSDLEALHAEIAAIRAELAGLAAPTAGIGQAPLPAALAASAPPAQTCPIVGAGFSPALWSEPAAADGPPPAPPRADAFARSLAQRLTAPAPEAALDAGILVILGASGSGRTTLAAKFAALAAQHRPDRACKLIEFAARGSTQPNDPLRRHARMLAYSQSWEITCERWHEEDLAKGLRLESGRLHIVDMPAVADLAERTPAILAAFEGLAPTARIVALPGSLGTAAIRAQLARPEAFGAQVALSKLDEGEIMPPELSALALAGGRIGWLSGTRALVGNLSPATDAILQDYISECLDRP